MEDVVELNLYQEILDYAEIQNIFGYGDIIKYKGVEYYVHLKGRIVRKNPKKYSAIFGIPRFSNMIFKFKNLIKNTKIK